MRRLMRAAVLVLVLCLPLAAAHGTPIVFAYTGAIVDYVVPQTGLYDIVAIGAQGGSGTYLGGLGAEIGGDFTLTAGEILQIAVGQRGGSGPGAPPGGFLGDPAAAFHSGGGGSFVVGPGNQKLVIAGGGGGSTDGFFFYSGSHGRAANVTPGGAGGTGGDAFGGGVGGLGWASWPAVSGCSGGSGVVVPGTFGGGGCADYQEACYGDLGCIEVGGSGGGGGYSGGAGGYVHLTNYFGDGTSGSGGGSYDGGTDQVLLPLVGTGDGSVTITPLSVVPEPPPPWLFGVGVGVSSWLRARRNSASRRVPHRDRGGKPGDTIPIR